MAASSVPFRAWKNGVVGVKYVVLAVYHLEQAKLFDLLWFFHYRHHYRLLAYHQPR